MIGTTTSPTRWCSAAISAGSPPYASGCRPRRRAAVRRLAADLRELVRGPVPAWCAAATRWTAGRSCRSTAPHARGSAGHCRDPAWVPRRSRACSRRSIPTSRTRPARSCARMPAGRRHLVARLGRIGLLARENVSLLNASLFAMARGTIAAFVDAIAKAGIAAPLVHHPERRDGSGGRGSGGVSGALVLLRADQLAAGRGVLVGSRECRRGRRRRHDGRRWQPGARLSSRSRQRRRTLAACAPVPHARSHFHRSRRRHAVRSGRSATASARAASASACRSAAACSAVRT